MLRLMLLLLCLLTSASSLGAISIIQLKRANDSILPMINQLLGENSSANIYQRQLILQASPEETTQVKQLLEQLDAHGESILISLKTDRDQQTNSNTQSESSIKSSKSRVSKTVKTTRSIGQSQGYAQQTIRATSGQASFISLGQSFYTGEHWHHADSGFFALARLHNNEVSIDIQQQESSLNKKSIVHQQLQSSVYGQLGQWLFIGSVMQQHDQQQSHVLRIYLKVDRL